MKRHKGSFIRPASDFAFRELLEVETVRQQLISDVTGIAMEEIKDTRLLNTFLWRSYRQQKLGIVDALMELQNGTKIITEMQLKGAKHWEKRQLFYWAKTFVKDLLWSEHYDRLTKCISIAILDFNLTDRPGAHTVYRLTDKDGNSFGDLLEIHTIELKKTASEDSGVKEWLEFFNAKKEEDLDMLLSKTKKPGIREAIEEVRRQGLFYRWRIIAEYKRKARMTRWAEDEYVRDEGRARGIIEASMDDGLSENEILNRLQSKLDISLDKAQDFYKQFALFR